LPELEAAQVKSGEAERGALAAAAEDGARAAAAANAALRARERALAAAEAALAHERGLRAHRAAVAQAGALAGACLVRGPTRAGAARRDRGADAAPERARRLHARRPAARIGHPHAGRRRRIVPPLSARRGHLSKAALAGG